MATATVSGVRIAGIASAVPELSCENTTAANQFGEAETKKLCASIGVQRRRVAPSDVCASDLCLDAAKRLMSQVGWQPDTIDGLIFVSQTPDYRLPATSCVLHARLGLASNCAAFDVGLGCSGYVYGLWQAAQLANSLDGRVLLLVGDTINKIVSPQDRATALLFGDAGSATAVEAANGTEPWRFVLGTDGTGWPHLLANGGLREDLQGTSPANEDLHLNGGEVFTFALRRVPQLIADTLAAADWTMDEVDAVVMHQANEFMLRHLAKRADIPPDKFVLALSEFGNTSCASIPLAITDCLRSDLELNNRRMLMVGFGVGWSWGAAAIPCGPIVAPGLVISESSSIKPRLRA